MVNFLVPLQIRMKHGENIFKMATEKKKEEKKAPLRQKLFSVFH